MAARAGQAMELVFNDLRHDDGQFRHLMTQGGGIVARQGPATTATGRGLAGDRLLDLLIGDEQTLVTAMARLPPAFLAWLVRRRRPAFAAKTVRRGGQRRVAGVGV